MDLFFNLLRNSSCIVGNSSAGIRESCYFGIPCVNIGSRQDNRERGKNVVNTDYSSKEVLGAIKKQLSHGKYDPEFIYGDGNAGKQIAEILSNVSVKQQKTWFS